MISRSGRKRHFSYMFNILFGQLTWCLVVEALFVVGTCHTYELDANLHVEWSRMTRAYTHKRGRGLNNFFGSSMLISPRMRSNS